MGYESFGWGEFKPRDGIKLGEAIGKVEEAGFDISEDKEGVFSIVFSGWTLYNSGEELQVIQKFFNGEFYIEGEENTDIWKMIFKDGKVFKQICRIVWDIKPEKIDLKDNTWD